MAKSLINRGSVANDGTGDNLRAGANKVNLNFDEIYSAIGDGTTLSANIKVKDDSSTLATINAKGDTLGILGGSGISSTISGSDVTLAVDGTVSTASGTQTFTNKTINGPDNTLTNIANTSLSNSTITLAGDSGSNAVDLGDTLTVSGTANQITTAQAGDTLTLSLPSAITVPGSLTVTGNFNVLGTQTVVDSNTIEVTNSFTFEGTTSDDFETVLTVTDPTADRTVTIPNATGTIVLKDTTDTLTNKSVNLANNTLTGTFAQFNTAVSDATLVDTAVSTALDSTTSGNKLRFNFANTGSLPTAATYEGMFAYDIGGNNPYVADAGGWVKLLSENSSIADISNVGSIASITNGQVLVWNSAGGRFDPGDQGAGFTAGTDLDQAGADIQDVGYIGHRSPDDSVVNTLTVTVATKTTEHYHHGTGSSSGYVIDGHESPALTLAPGVHRFDQSDSSNSGHPLLFYSSWDKARLISTGVTTSGTPGSSGAYTQIEIDGDTPTPLYYQCSSHAYMGHVVEAIQGKQRRINNTTDKTNTGDGSTTAFTVLNGYTVDDVLVIVNGIVLTPTDDYTISSTTLTFTSAPAASAGIVIRYLG